MAIDSDISGSIVAGHQHEEKHTEISEIPIGNIQEHASDSPTGSADHIDHEQENQHSGGQRQ